VDVDVVERNAGAKVDIVLYSLSMMNPRLEIDSLKKEFSV